MIYGVLLGILVTYAIDGAVAPRCAIGAAAYHPRMSALRAGHPAYGADRTETCGSSAAPLCVGKHMNGKLRKEQYWRIKRWEKRMIVFFIMAMSLTVITIAFCYLFNCDDEIQRIVWATIILCVVPLGVVLQFSEKCPKCGHRLGFQTRLTLPERCKKCGVSYENPGENA